MRRTTATLVLVTLLAPATPAAGDELDAARQRVEALAAEVRAAERALDAIEEELATQRAALAELERAAAAARAREAAALRQLEAANAALAAIDLPAAVADWQQHRDRLAARLSALYKRGPTTPPTVGVLLAAEDLHDLVVWRRALDRHLEEDLALLHSHRDATLALADRRRQAAMHRAAAVAARQQAAAARRAVESLTARQQQVVAAVTAEQERRAALLARFAADHARAQALLDELQRRAARVDQALVAAVAAAYGTDPDQGWVARLPSRGRPWAGPVVTAAQATGVDPRLLAALVWAESGFRPDAVSSAGAVGLTQLLPTTAAMLGVDPYDPAENLLGGARYLRRQLDTFGALELALAAYNAGPGAVVAHGGIPPYPETQFYVLRVLRLLARLLDVEV